MDEEEKRGYAWEAEYKRSWDILQQEPIQQIVQHLQTRKRKDQPIKRGMIRQMVVVVDCTRSMSDLDLRPTRMELTIELVKEFVNDYFDQNPLSMLMVVGIRDGLAERWTGWAGNATELLQQLDKVSLLTAGDPSLQNALELSRQTLIHAPTHVSREILVLYGGLSSCDPSSLDQTILNLVNDQIRVSIIGLAAQLRVCQTIADKTKGTYHIVMNEAHYKELFSFHVPPPPMLQTKPAQMIQMGFPISKTFPKPALCLCHNKTTFKGYECPKCKSTVCEIPQECPICSLLLVSSPSLARSYHHLFPVPIFKEMSELVECFSCQGERSGFQCPRCTKSFCVDCDLYIHDILHSCPGCISI